MSQATRMDQAAAVCDKPNPVQDFRPRIVFIIPGSSQGSSMIFCRRQAEACRARGADVKEFFLSSRTSPRMLLSEWRRCRGFLKAYQADAVHAQFGTMTAMFSVLAAGRLPLVITYRGSDLNAVPFPFPGLGSLARLLSQLASLRASRIVCVSEQLRQRLWWRRSIASVLPTGVDADEFRPTSREAARRKLGWPMHRRIVLFNAGGDPRNKRLDLAQAAVAYAEEILPDILMKVSAGDVPPNRMPAWMNAADCLLITSDLEGSPTVVQEALACNLPIVSVAVGDVPQRLEGVDGTRIVSRDPSDIADALVSLLKPLRRSDGRKKTPEFSARSIAERLMELYREAIPSATSMHSASTHSDSMSSNDERATAVMPPSSASRTEGI